MSTQPISAQTSPAADMAAEPFPLASALNEPRHVDRREERRDTNWISMIRLLDGTEIPCNVKDVSPSGAKLGVPSAHKLPDAFMLKVIGRDFVCLVRLAWRRGDYAGVKIERVGKLAAAERAAVDGKASRSEAPVDYRTLGSRRSRVSSF